MDGELERWKARGLGASRDMEPYLAIVGVAVFLSTGVLFSAAGGSEELPKFFRLISFAAAISALVGIVRWVTTEESISTTDVRKASVIGAGIFSIAFSWAVVTLLRFQAHQRLQTHIPGPADFFEEMDGTNPTQKYMLQAQMVRAELQAEGLTDQPIEVVARENPDNFTELLESLVAMGDSPVGPNVFQLVPEEHRERILDAAEHATRAQIARGLHTWAENVELLHEHGRLQELDTSHSISEKTALNAGWSVFKVLATFVAVALAAFAILYVAAMAIIDRLV